MDVGARGGSAKGRRPGTQLAAAERRLAEMVDHDGQLRERTRELGHVAEVPRVDAGKLEDHAGPLEQRKALEHGVLQDPVRIVLIVDQVAEAAQTGPAAQLAEALCGALGRAEVDPADHGADPGVALGLLQHRVGVRVGVGRLHQHGPRHAGPDELRRELLRLERPADAGMSVPHPRQRFALEIPEVVVCIDDHGFEVPPRGASESSRSAAPACSRKRVAPPCAG